MAKYEVMFIVRTDVTDEDLDKLIAQMQSVVTGAGGKPELMEKMGRRRLAYRVQRQREGFYILFTLEGNGDTVKEFERRLKVTDSVIKYMTVRLDDQLKRAEKLKKHWAEREAKRPRAPKPPTPAATRPAETPAQG